MKYFIITIMLCLTTGTIFAQNNEELYLVESGRRMNGPVVKRLQKFLVFNGINIGPDGVDGWFGTDTEKALREFQKSRKMKVTGRIAVKDIPQSLDFSTELKEWSAGKLPVDSGFSKRSIKEGGVKTWFGKITIKADPLYEEYLSNLALSPSERFVTYLAYSPMVDMQIGQSLVVTDILTGKYSAVNALQVFVDLHDEYEFDEIFVQTEYSQILKYFWISEKELFITVEVIPFDGKSLKASGVLVIMM